MFGGATDALFEKQPQFLGIEVRPSFAKKIFHHSCRFPVRCIMTWGLTLRRASFAGWTKSPKRAWEAQHRSLGRSLEGVERSSQSGFLGLVGAPCRAHASVAPFGRHLSAVGL
jgi:hypothetical protein